ncbi:MAG: permease [Spirochaetaceae bacterium]|nr:permease [Spirochaetaceae bacterium]
MTDLAIILARELWRIAQFVAAAFAHTWPLWVLSIPLAAAIKQTNVASRLERAISLRPAAAVILATLFGAVSPLCSCSVIPVIFSLLSAGMPLAPVMSFWLASP